jgi:outer membrane protein
MWPRACQRFVPAVLVALGCMGNECVQATQTNSTTSYLSLSDCIRMALKHNLDIQIVRYDVEVSRDYLRGAYGAYEPVLDVSGSHSFSASPGGVDAQNRPFLGTTSDSDYYQANIGTLLPTGLQLSLRSDLGNTTGAGPSGTFANGFGAASIQMRQPLLRNFWIDSSRMTIQVSKKELAISELALRQQIMNTVNDTTLAYYDLVLAKERIKIQQEALDLAEHLVNESKSRVNLGVLARQDEKQTESQLLARQSDLLGAQGALTIQEYAMKALVTDDVKAWNENQIEPTSSLAADARTFSVAQSWTAGLAKRPDLLQAKADLERQGIVIKFLKNQIFPELDLTGDYGQAGSGVGYNDALDGIRTGTSPFFSFGAELRIPLAGNRNASANYQASKATLKQSVLRFKQLENSVMVQIGTAVQTAETRLAQVDKTRQSREFAETALEAEQKKLQSGKSSEFVVVQLQKDLTSARLAEAQALIDYNKALTGLALREGTIMEQSSLELEVK